MANYLIQDSTLTNIANSIRGKTGKAEPILTENMSAEIDSITGGGENPLEYVTSLKNAYSKVSFPTDYSLTLSVPNITDLSNVFYESLNLKKVKIKSLGVGSCLIDSAFRGCLKMESLDLTEFEKSFNLSFDFVFYQCKMLKDIKGILDVSNAKSYINAFFGCGELTEISFKAESIKVNIKFNVSNKLSDNSIQSIIDGLATVEAPQTLTLHPTVKAKLTPEQTQTISAKNWILA